MLLLPSMVSPVSIATLRSIKFVSSLLYLRTSTTQTHLPSACTTRRHYIKNYDKRILLSPEDVEYKYGDSQFLPGPSFADEPYIRPTNEEMVELTRIKLESEIARSTITQIDPNQAPFNQLMQGVDDGGRFTEAEVIPDNESRWFWVQRLMPRQLLDQPINPNSTLIAPLPDSAPELPYFVSRTRSRLYPLYRRYEVVGRNMETYWRNRWDHRFNKYHADILHNLDEIKWENKEETITLTEVFKISGDIWRFEEDARRFLERRHCNHEGEPRIFSSVNEARGRVSFKGDFVTDLFDFLKQQGF